jgi:hypothetical protein
VLTFLIDVVGAPVYKGGDLPGTAALRAMPGTMIGRASGLTTAAHEACDGGHADALDVLIERGASASRLDGQGREPAVLAIASGSFSCVKLLWEKRAITKAFGTCKPVAEAARLGHLDILRFLVDVAGFGVVTKRDIQPLVAAVLSESWTCARWLLRRCGANPEVVVAASLAAVAKGGDAFLFEVAERGDAALFDAIVQGGSTDEANLAFLVRSCAWFRSAAEADNCSRTIQLAARAKHCELLRFLATIRIPTRAELGLGEIEPVNRPWLEAMAELYPDWSGSRFADSLPAFAWRDATFAIAHGCAISPDEALRLCRRSRISPADVHALAAVDRRAAIMFALASGRRGALDALRDAGVAPTSAELRSINWADASPTSVSVWLKAVADLRDRWASMVDSRSGDVELPVGYCAAIVHPPGEGTDDEWCVPSFGGGAFGVSWGDDPDERWWAT